MSSLVNSKAFDNFIKERTNEVIQNDEKYQKINQQFLQIESQLLKLLNNEQKNKYFELDKLRENLIDYLSTSFYKTYVLEKIGVK